MSPALAEARAAFDREAWREAHALLSAVDREAPLAPEDLERLAAAAYLIGRDAETAEALTRAYNGFLERGEAVRAARSAFWLAFASLDKPDKQAQAAGWLARARRLIEESRQPCAEEGLVLCAFAFQKAGQGDAAAALAAFRQAADIGERCRDRDVTALARHGEGRALVRMNRKAEGLTLLDEVMLGVTRGEVSPMIAGVVYCSVIGACHELFDWRRAQEWTEALAGWCEAHPDMVPFRGTCLVRRSEVLQLRGAWRQAMDEARRACERLSQPAGQPEAGAAHFQLAELHRLRGAFGEAEQAYRLAQQAGGRLYAGPALLRLAQGQTEAACAAIRRALQETRDRRSRALVLRGCVEILLAGGDLAAARSAAEELERLAADIEAPFLHAASAAAAGAVALAAGEAGTALPLLRDAETAWQQLDAPYELARVRMLLGLAYRDLADREGAALEFEAAQDIFEDLGAAPDAERAAALAETVTTPATRDRGKLTGREVEVLRLVATGRTNRAIAGALRISEKTVARHLSNIFVKLDISSRAAATAYAYEHKLV